VSAPTPNPATRDRLISLLKKWQYPDPWHCLAAAVKEYRQRRQFITENRRLDDMDWADGEWKKKIDRLEVESAEMIRADVHRLGAEVGEIYLLIKSYYPRLLPKWGPELRDIDPIDPDERSRAVVAILAEVLALDGGTPSTPAHTPPQALGGAGHQPEEPHPDGPEGGRWLWWGNRRHDIPQGNVYRMIAYMWGRDSASYDDLIGPVFDNPVEPKTIRSYANKVKNALPPGFPWRLSTDAVNRQLTKVPATAKGE
jgi:hypothetical protein